MGSSFMAVVKVSYIPKTGRVEEVSRAKANIRYIQNRGGREGERLKRPLFGTLGFVERREAYRMIDESAPKSTFFRVIINFDQKTEDTRRDLNHREIMEQVMQALYEQTRQPLSWVAVLHDDHTPLRHLHALVVSQVRLLPVQLMRGVATEASLEQRRELDQERELQRERKEAEWERSL